MAQTANASQSSRPGSSSSKALDHKHKEKARALWKKPSLLQADEGDLSHLEEDTKKAGASMLRQSVRVGVKTQVQYAVGR